MATRSKIIQQSIQRTMFGPKSVTGSSEIMGTVIDTKGYDSVSLGLFIGTLTGSGTHSMVVKIYENAANSTSGGTDITADVIDLPPRTRTPLPLPLECGADGFRWQGTSATSTRRLPPPLADRKRRL